MINVTINNARVAKGFGENPAVYTNEAGTLMSFRVSWKKGDDWENLTVRVINPTLVDRCKKMEIKEGTFLTLFGELDFQTFTAKDGTKQKTPYLLLKDLAYARGIPSSTIVVATGIGGHISAGYEDRPAIFKNDKGTLAAFKVGYPVYDKNAENNTRWENIDVKIIGEFAKVVDSLKLDAKAVIDFSGEFGFDKYEKDGKTYHRPVITLDRIARVNSAKKKEDGEDAPAAAAETTAPAEPVAAPSGFAGTEDYPDDLPF